MTKSKKIGIKIRTIRKKAGFSAKKLARKLSVDPSYISKIEKGTEKPSKDLLIRLMLVLNLDTDSTIELWNLAGFREPPITNRSYEDKPKIKSSVKTKHEGVISVKSNGDSVVKMTDRKPKTGTLKVDSKQFIIYTDLAIVNSNPHGLVINFAQTVAGSPTDATVAARIGMSIEHAESLAKALVSNVNKTKSKK